MGKGFSVTSIALSEVCYGKGGIFGNISILLSDLLEAKGEGGRGDSGDLQYYLLYTPKVSSGICHRGTIGEVFSIDL